MKNYFHKVNILDLLEDGEEIAAKDVDKVLRIMGDEAIKLIKEDCKVHRSSVTGTPFKGLSKDYARKTHKKRSDMHLKGDMLSSLSVGKLFQSAVRIRINGNKNNLKAENHLKRDRTGSTVGRAEATKVPMRKFFPTGEEKLRKGILSKIREKISGYIVETDENGNDKT